jgi:hypothetical protein
MLTVARVFWGAALLLAPSSVIGDLPRGRIDRSSRLVARLLGARQLAEAVFTGRHRSRRAMLAGAAVDATHAATCAALGLMRPDRRRLALSNAATATAFAVAGLAQSRRARPDARSPE